MLHHHRMACTRRRPPSPALVVDDSTPGPCHRRAAAGRLAAARHRGSAAAVMIGPPRPACAPGRPSCPPPGGRPKDAHRRATRGRTAAGAPRPSRWSRYSSTCARLAARTSAPAAPLAAYPPDRPAGRGLLRASAPLSAIAGAQDATRSFPGREPSPGQHRLGHESRVTGHARDARRVVPRLGRPDLCASSR